MSTPAEINQRNQAFWSRLQPRLDALLEDVAVRETAYATIQSDQRRCSFENQRSYAQALLDAEETGRRFRAQFERKIRPQIEVELKAEMGRKGGRAKKATSLYQSIVGIVREQPDIPVRLLEKRLRDLAGGGVIEEVTEKVIHFIGRDGRSREAQLSGLKHLLTRARKSVAK